MLSSGCDGKTEAGMDSLEIDESARKRFEADWRARHAQPIEAYLPPSDDPRYVATLEELIHIELEFAWKSNPTDGPLVERYLVLISAVERTRDRASASAGRIRSAQAVFPSGLHSTNIGLASAAGISSNRTLPAIWN